MSKFKTLIIVSAVILIALAVISFLLPPREPKLTVGPDTTVLDGPLRDDGFVDYAKALDQMMAEGIEPERNAAVVLARLTYQKEMYELYPEFCDQLFGRLGVDVPQSDGAFVASYNFNELIKFRKDLLYGDEFEMACSEPWTEQKYPNAAAWIAANERSLDLIQQMNDRDQFYYPSKSVNDTNATRELTKLFDLSTAHGFLMLGEGNWESCANDSIQIAQMSKHFCSKYIPLAPFCYTNLRLESKLIEMSDWDSERCLARIRELDSVAFVPELASQIDLNERFHQLENLRELLQMTETNYGISPTEFQNVNVDPIARTLNSMFDEAVAVIKIIDPVNRRSKLESLEELVDQTTSYVVPGFFESLSNRRNVNSKVLIAKVVQFAAIVRIANHLHEQKSFYQTSQELVRIGWAIKAFQYDENRYPAELDELVPKYLAEIPNDAYSGVPLIYKTDNDKFVLVSVGPNLRDDSDKKMPRQDDIGFGAVNNVN